MGRRGAWGWAAFGAALLVACSPAKPVASRATPSGGGSLPAASANPLPTVSPIADACTLATAAQVSTAFGGSAAPGVSVKFALVPICEFSMTGSPLGVSGVQVWALVRTGAGAFQGKQPGGVAVAGVGDAAYYFPALRQLTLLKDGNAVLVRAQFGGATPAPPDTSGVKAAVVALAAVVAKGL